MMTGNLVLPDTPISVIGISGVLVQCIAIGIKTLIYQEALDVFFFCCQISFECNVSLVHCTSDLQQPS